LDVAHGFSSYAHQGKVLQVTSASFKARRVNPKTFFAELKRRNVYKVAIAYNTVVCHRRWIKILLGSREG
jgi:hypothetical protein